MKQAYFSRRFLTIAATGVAVAAMFVLFLSSQKSSIPLPFSFRTSDSLVGQLVNLGRKGAVKIRKITFDAGEVSEILRGDELLNSMDIILIPDSDTISHGAKLCDAVTAGKKYFGYKYTSRNASIEIAARDAALESGAPKSLTELFEGKFFASVAMRNASNFIANFETATNEGLPIGATPFAFADPCNVTLDKNARYVIKVEDTNTTFTARGLVVEETGNLFVSGLPPPYRRQLLGGQARQGEILFPRFTAHNEDIEVTKIVFTGSGPDAAVVHEQVDLLELWIPGDSNYFAVATVDACGTDPVPPNSFCASMESQQFVVPKDTSVTVLVGANMKSDLNGAVSGRKVGFYIDGNTATQTVQARGVASANVLKENDGDMTEEGEIFIGRTDVGANEMVPGLLHTSVLAKLDSIVNANPDEDESGVPTGNAPVGQFKFTAQASNNTKNGLNDWVLADVIFTIDAANVQFDENAFKLYNKADASVKKSCVLLDSQSSQPTFFVACWDILGTSSVNAEIDAGTNQTFVLEASITNPAVDPAKESSVQVSLKNFTDSTKDGMAVSLNHLSWLDKDGSTLERFFWIESSDTEVASTYYVTPAPVCRNGVPEGDEQCDDGNDVENDSCNSLCIAARCGDNVHQANGADNIAGTPDDEDCDDGYTANNDDVCDNSCRVLSPF